MEHPFDRSLTTNTRSWNDAVGSEHLYDEPDDIGEVVMAAVPSTIGPAAYRRPVHETERRLRVVTGAEGLPGRNPLPGRAPAGVSARRRLATLAAVVGLVGLWFGTGALASGERLAPRPTLRVTAGTVYVVGGGDSLASIARRISPPDEVPAVVRVLRSELHGHPLRAGMVLRVP